MKNDVLIGWGLILLGIAAIWYARKYVLVDSAWGVKTRGYVGGVACIIAGLSYLRHC